MATLAGELINQGAGANGDFIGRLNHLVRAPPAPTLLQFLAVAAHSHDVVHQSARFDLPLLDMRAGFASIVDLTSSVAAVLVGYRLPLLARVHVVVGFLHRVLASAVVLPVAFSLRALDSKH